MSKYIFISLSLIYSNILESDLINYNNKFYLPNSYTPYSGDIVEYHPNKIIFYEGKYSEGIRHGNFNYYYEDGSTYKNEIYIYGKKTGLWIEYDESGILLNKKLFEKEGYVFTSFYKNLAIESTGKYIDNKKDGLWIDYFQNGNKMKETYYEKGVIDSSKTILFKPKYVFNKLVNEDLNDNQIENNKNIKEEKISGEYLTLYNDSNIESKQILSENLLEGEQFDYYENGRLLRKRFYTKGYIDTSKFTYEYYNSGQLLSMYKENILDKELYMNGMFISYYKNGKKLLEGNYNNNIKTGDWLRYYDSGELYSRANYNNLSSDSTLYIEYYYKNGQMSSNENIINGKENYLHGKYVSYYDSGEIRKEGSYINNIKDGLWQEYYKSGKILSKINFVDQNGIYYSYYESGEILSEGYFLDNHKNGVWIEYFKNGNKKIKMDYLNDNLDINSPVISYTEAGDLFSERYVIMIDNKIINDGLYIEYYQSGNVHSKGTYSLGHRSGKWLDSYEDGSLYSELNLKNGSGMYTSYYPSGDVLSLGQYKNHKKNGKWKKFYKNGKLSWEYYYIDDEIDPNKLCSYWYETGYKRSEGYLINNNEKLVWDGHYREFFESGIIYLIGEYLRGDKSGLWKQFYNNRALHSEKIYNNGIPEGEWLFYNKYGEVVKIESY